MQMALGASAASWYPTSVRTLDAIIGCKMNPTLIDRKIELPTNVRYDFPMISIADRYRQVSRL